MKKKTGKQYFNEQGDKMKAHLQAFIEKDDQEELHDFRVQVKKLRAMLTMLDNYSSHKLLKDFKPVRKIFKQGGLIRDAHLHLESGKHYHITNEQFLENQQRVITDGIGQFKNNRSEYLKALKRSHREIEDRLKPVPDSRINDFYKKELEQIALILSNLQFDESLHKCRRQIKILMYNLKFTHKALEGKLTINEDYLNKLQAQIGKWHDNILAIELFSSPEVDDQAVVYKLKRKNTMLKKSIKDLSADFLNKVIKIEVTESEN